MQKSRGEEFRRLLFIAAQVCSHDSSIGCVLHGGAFCLRFFCWETKGLKRLVCMHQKILSPKRTSSLKGQFSECERSLIVMGNFNCVYRTCDRTNVNAPAEASSERCGLVRSTYMTQTVFCPAQVHSLSHRSPAMHVWTEYMCRQSLWQYVTITM